VPSRLRRSHSSIALQFVGFRVVSAHRASSKFSPTAAWLGLWPRDRWGHLSLHDLFGGSSSIPLRFATASARQA